MTTYKYRVCQVQGSRVTFVNGEWQGSLPLTPDADQDALQSCPKEWEFLATAGAAGWSLTAALGSVGGESAPRILYLQREIDG